MHTPFEALSLDGIEATVDLVPVYPNNYSGH
jgi:hypothetical protein